MHWFLIARRQIDAESLFATPADSALPMVRPTALVALALGVTATWMFMYGMLPALQGPVAVALGGIDLSWLAGGVVAGTSYWAMEKLTAPRAA